MAKRLTALVLQGGGALGAYEYGVLKALYEKSGFVPDVVTGVSIGAVNAAVLVGARHDPIEALGELWHRLTALDIPFLPQVMERALGTLGNAGMYRLRPEVLWAPLAITSIYDTAPLRAVLEDLVDLGKLNASATRVVVTAVEVTSGELRAFDNDNTHAQGLSYDHIIASGSLPPGFPMTDIGGRRYWDGGLFSNTPLSAAINCLESLAPDGPDAEREVIVVELFPRSARVPSNMMEVLDRMVELAFADKLRVDEKLFQRMSDFIDLLGDVDRLLARCETVSDDGETRNLIRKIKNSEVYADLERHRKIDYLTVVTNAEPESVSGPTDFSAKAIEGRIQAGYRDARGQLERAGWYQPAPATAMGELQGGG